MYLYIKLHRFNKGGLFFYSHLSKDQRRKNMLCPFKKETRCNTTLGGTVTSTEENFMDSIGEECVAYKKVDSILVDYYYYECGLTNTIIKKEPKALSEEFVNNLL